MTSQNYQGLQLAFCRLLSRRGTGVCETRRAAILLSARRTQTVETMGVERALPGTELLLRQLVTTTGLLECKFAAAHGGDHSSLPTDHPSSGVVRRWIFHAQRSYLTHQKPFSSSSTAMLMVSPCSDHLRKS
jgi:hypothetical protein